MKKKKSIIRILLPWLIAVAAIAAIVIFIGIPLYGTPDTANENPPTVLNYDGGKAALTMENDSLLFELDPTTTQFQVTDKASGEVWLSNPADADKDSVALSSNKDALKSTIRVTYQNKSGSVEMNNYTYSIENQNYTIEQTEDGAIAVHYTIGKIDKVYLIPVAVPKARYEELMDRMDSKTQKKVKSNYSLYEPEKLDTKSNKDEIIAMYPEVENQAMYILSSDTSDSTKKKLAGYFADSGYTQEDYDADSQYVAGSADSSGGVFNVTIRYRLDGGDLVVEVPYEDIRYKEDYPIVNMTVLPMFGAMGTDESGWIFIPEGGGALIQCNNGKLSQNSYYANLYGWDYASYRSEVVSETRVSFPVFGMLRENSAMMCIMEEGASYGAVMADISMRYNSYNWVCARYNVLHSDQYNVSAKTAQLVYMYEQAVPTDIITQRYRFLSSGSYVDMANAYGDYLAETHESVTKNTASADVPVSVELVGAIDKTVVKFGLPIDSVVPTTTFSQAESIITELVDGGVKGLSVRFSGWANGGVNQRVLTSVHVESVLGGESGMKQLISTAADKLVNLYFDGISCFAYDSNVFNGFITFMNAARLTTREVVELYPYSIITYVEDDADNDPYYLVKAGYADSMATNLRNSLAGMKAAGIGYRDIGYLLSSDFTASNTVTREQVKAMNIEQMKASRNAGLKVAIREGNDYALPYADLITDMNLAGQSYSIIDKTIPFYQIAIHGMQDYTGASINLSGDWQKEVLVCAEYGSGLNFTLMAENTQILQDTVYSGYYGAYYADWKDTILQTVVKYQTDMAGLNNLHITGHEVLEADLTATTYEDGTVVYVNYNLEDRTANGVNVPARSYVVERK